jgi:hypothetical protein
MDVIVDSIEYLIYRGSMHPQELGECTGVDFPHVCLSRGQRIVELAKKLQRTKRNGS